MPSHNANKASVLTEQSVYVKTLVRMTWANQQNDVSGHNDATCVCLNANVVPVLLKKTADIIFLSYTTSFTSSLEGQIMHDLNTKVQGFRGVKDLCIE